MGIPEAARRLHVADADIREVVAHEDGGHRVHGFYGATWIITEDDEVYSYGPYHPHTKSLKRYEDRPVADEDKADKAEDAEDAEDAETGTVTDDGDGVSDQSEDAPERSSEDDENKAEGGDGDGDEVPDPEPGKRDTAVDEVPQGNITEVLEWVGDDADRAQRALDVEQTAEVPRKRLIAELEKRTGG